MLASLGKRPRKNPKSKNEYFRGIHFVDILNLKSMMSIISYEKSRIETRIQGLEYIPTSVLP